MTGKLQYEKDIWYVELPSYEDDFGTPTVGKRIQLDPTFVKYYFLDEDAIGQEVEFIINDYGFAGQYAKLIKPEEESPLIIRLREHLNNITPEEFQKEIEEIESTYPVCEEDCPHCAYERQEVWEAELEKDACIEFAKWLAQSDWMSIWVENKWMWECQLDDSKLGYKTEEELYQIYLNEI